MTRLPPRAATYDDLLALPEHWRQKKVTESRMGIGTRFDGYTDCLDIASSEQLLTAWMYDKRLIELQVRERDPRDYLRRKLRRLT